MTKQLQILAVPQLLKYSRKECMINIAARKEQLFLRTATSKTFETLPRIDTFMCPKAVGAPWYFINKELFHNH